MPQWFKIQRNILEWEWWSKQEMVVLLLYIIASVRAEDTEYNGKNIRKGQLITSLGKLVHDNPCLTKKTARTCLKRLSDIGYIEVETTRDCTIITLCDYDKYYEEQLSNSGSPIPEREHTSAPKKTLAVQKSDLAKRAEKFYNSLVPYVMTYGKEMMREFYDYWSEPNKSFSKMRYENEKTWQLERRLARWASRQKEYKSNGTNKNYSDYGSRQQCENATSAVEDFLTVQ